MRKRAKTDYSLGDIYGDYLKSTPKEILLPRKKFMSINKRFIALVTDKILLESEEVKLPILGTLRIKKFKNKFDVKKLKIDFAETKKQGRKMYHLNEHRAGFAYRFSWRKSKIVNNTYYSFTPERYNLKRRLAKILKNRMDIDYFL